MTPMSCADCISDCVPLDIIPEMDEVSSISDYTHLLHKVEHQRNLLISPVPIYPMDTHGYEIPVHTNCLNKEEMKEQKRKYIWCHNIRP